MLLARMGTGVAVGAVALISTEAFAKACDTNHPCRTQIVPPRNRQRLLRAQPPYKRSQDQWRKRTKGSKTKHKTRLKSRSLRAQRTYDTPGNRRDLALTIWGEARGYGTNGMRAVGHVIMNRVKADKKRFGFGIHGVCYKRKQFSCHNKNDPNKLHMTKLPTMDENNPDWIAFMKADKIAGEILAGISKDMTGGATFYFAESMRPYPYWINDMTIIGVMFGHMFCKEKTRKQRKRQRKAVHPINKRHR
jgi:spore germination cell wall hydrolase CwlJ-like protein